MTISKTNNSRIVLITGASSGIGAKTAEFLASMGFTVLLVARRKDKLAAIANQIQTQNGRAHFFEADLTIEQARVDLIATLERENLFPDILINNAGFGWYGHFETMSWQTGKDLIAINIEAVAHLTHLVLTGMLQKGYGHIINIGSVAGKLPEQGIALYSSSKAFLDAFTSSLYRELRGSHVTASVVRLGPIQTEFFDAARSHKNGGNVPAENMAIPAEVVARGIYRLINHPQKVVYIPFYLFISPLLETFFSGILDMVGPLLLGKKKSQS
jgi:short-subunit dehydrogenase